MTVNPSTATPTIYFRHNGADSYYGKLAKVALVPGAAPEFLGEFNCEVVHVAGERGLCLAAERGALSGYFAWIFDVPRRHVLYYIPLAGTPSRGRVAADGRRAAMTVFVSGHGYDSVDFSTQTLLIDLTTGEVEADLESFTVSKDGTPFKSHDFNFWGVTFERDSRFFYATLASAGKYYLVRGDAEQRRAVVIREGMECPSLSPDGTRIAFKKRSRATGPVHWDIAIYDIASGVETQLAERQSVDDQPEWLDPDRVLYSMPARVSGSSVTTDVWVARADGKGQPERLLAGAYSPAVLR